MKIDAVTIFPEYFAPLQLSLLGKAQEQGLVEVGIHDLRSFSTDNHNTVDDTPYGGGAGMVMLPEIWGKALDHLMTPETHLIILTPAGKRFDQPMAAQFSQAKHLVFACGRYEGIDDRVRQHYESKNYRVHEVSIGDYVLGGGEVASLVMIEAITRLIPGVLGNPESLAEESHNEGGTWSIQTSQSHPSGEILKSQQFCSAATMGKLLNGVRRKHKSVPRRISRLEVELRLCADC